MLEFEFAFPIVISVSVQQNRDVKHPLKQILKICVVGTLRNEDSSETLYFSSFISCILPNTVFHYDVLQTLLFK